MFAMILLPETFHSDQVNKTRIFQYNLLSADNQMRGQYYDRD